MPQHPSGGEHGQFRVGSGAGGGAENSNILASGGVHQLVVKAGLSRGTVAPEGRQPVGLHQAGIVIFPHAARIE